MSGRYYAPSAGAGAASALEAFLVQRAEQQRQAQVDALAKEKQEAEIAAERDRVKVAQDTLAFNREAEQGRQTDAQRTQQFNVDSFAIQNAMGGEAVDPETAARYQRTGLGSGLRKIPGVVMQGAQYGEDTEGVPLYDVNTSPDSYAMAGSREARMAELARTAQAERDTSQRQFESEQNRLQRDLQADIARGARGSEAADRSLRKAIAEQGADSKHVQVLRAAIDAAKTDDNGMVSYDPMKIAENYGRFMQALSNQGGVMATPDVMEFGRDPVTGRIVPRSGRSGGPGR